MFRSLRAGTLILGTLLIVGCGDKKSAEKDTIAALKDKQASSLLQYVPADTPYFIGTLEPLDDKVMKKLRPMTEEILEIYGDLLSKVLLESRNVDSTDETPAAVKKFIKVLGEELEDSDLEDFGIEMNTTQALYGHGLLPVFRLTLADAEKFEESILRLEKKSGSAMDKAELDGKAYRFFEQDKARVVLAVIESQAIVSLVPAGASDELLAQVFGTKKPKKNLGETSRLSDQAAKHGFLPQSSGFFDTVRLTNTFLDEQSGPNAELLAMMGYDKSSISNECREEILEMAQVMPQMKFGYTTIDATRFDANVILELRPDLANGLKPIATPVPGVGGDMGGVFSFGFSFNFDAAYSFIQGRFDAIEADPYKCEYFADLQKSVESGRQAMNAPLPPLVNNIKGAAVIVDSIENFDFSGGSPPEVDMRALLAIDDAPSVLMMGQMLFPPLAQLSLEPNGEVVKLPAGAVPGVTDSVYAALSANAITVGLGDDAQTLLPGMLSAKSPEHPPLHSMSYDMGAYMGFVGAAMDNATGRGGDGDDADVPMEEVQELFRVLEKYLDRSSLNIIVTDTGIEIPYTLTLK